MGRRAIGDVRQSALAPTLAWSSSRLPNRWPTSFKVKVHEGVLVTEVQPDTPAAKAGLKTGDIILDFAGRALSIPREFQGWSRWSKPAAAHPLTILRDGKQMTLK